MNPRAAIIAFVVAAASVHSQEAAKPAAPAGQYQLKAKSSFTAPSARAPFIPIGWVKKDGPVVMVQRATLDETAFRVTSILLGNPALAVINGKSYEEGQFLRMPRNGPQLRIRVYRITDGKVWLQYEDKLFTVPLKRPEIGERKIEEPLLNEDREVVPMPDKPSAATPAPVPVKPR